MKKLITCTGIAFFVMSALAIAVPDKAEMIANEKDAWLAFKDKKADEFQKMLAPDYRGLYTEGIYDRDREMAAMTKMDLKSFELSEFDVIIPDADTVMLTYKVTMLFAVDGREHSGIYNSASVWKNKNGAWQVILHSNIEQEKPQVPPH